MNKPELRGLYAITPDESSDTRLYAAVEATLSGGCHLLQYRDKLSPMPQKLSRARQLRLLTKQYGAKLIINDDLALCCQIDADGLHCGRDDGPLAQARAILGPDKILGASCYTDLSLAEAALRAGADYVAFGAVYPSPTKPDAPRAAVDLFKQAKINFSATTCAIGGIALDNAKPLIAAGADLLAVITDLFGAPDIAARAAAYQSLFQE